MQVDAYQLCPCGSGKKIKFCKCGENFSELDKIDRMIEGGQLIAALDRINSLLKSSPNTAWLLALKAQIQVHLQEFDALAETAGRFYRLKPNNPLALFLLAFSGAVRDDSIGASVKHYLEGLAEIREHVHPFVRDVTTAIVQRLLMQGNHLEAILLTQLALRIINDDVLRQMHGHIISDQESSLLVRISPELIPAPENVPWGERFNESESLIRGNRILQAHTKLYSLNREYPDQPAILSRLLHCELLRCESSAAYQAATRLAKCESLDMRERVYYTALAMEIDPEQAGVVVPRQSLELELTHAELELLENALMASSSVLTTTSDEIRRDYAEVNGLQVPPKLIAHLFGFMPVGLNDPSRARMSALVALFGRQTDRAPYVRLERLFPCEWESQYLSDLLATAELSLDRFTSRDKVGNSMLPTLFESRFFGKGKEVPENMYEWSFQMQHWDAELFAPTLRSVKLPCFDNKSFDEAIADSSYKLTLAGLLFYLRAQERRVPDGVLFRKLWQEWNLPAVTAEKQAEPQVSAANLYWVDLETCPNEDFLSLAYLAISMGFWSFSEDIIAQLDKRSLSAEEQKAMRLVRASTMLQRPLPLAEKRKWIEEVVEIYNEGKRPVGPHVIEFFKMLLSVNEMSEAQDFLVSMVRKYPQDPHLIALIKQMVPQQLEEPTLSVDRALHSRIGMERPRVSESRASEGSGIWTPDQGSSDSGGEGSGSKLWIPGMD